MLAREELRELVLRRSQRARQLLDERRAVGERARAPRGKCTPRGSDGAIEFARAALPGNARTPCRAPGLMTSRCCVLCSSLPSISSEKSVRQCHAVCALCHCRAPARGCGGLLTMAVATRSAAGSRLMTAVLTYFGDNTRTNRREFASKTRRCAGGRFRNPPHKRRAMMKIVMVGQGAFGRKHLDGLKNIRGRRSREPRRRQQGVDRGRREAIRHPACDDEPCRGARTAWCGSRNPDVADASACRAGRASHESR